MELARVRVQRHTYKQRVLCRVPAVSVLEVPSVPRRNSSLCHVAELQASLDAV
jgi:hypothetical protein